MTANDVIERIVSGGQTGADRAALDVALALGLPTGGWVPAGRRAEDGVVPARYAGLVETETADFAERTRLNVRDSDATLIITLGHPTGGTALTVGLAHELGRPCLVVDLDAIDTGQAAKAIRAWLADTQPRVLNVAGPRLSKAPRITDAAERVLRQALQKS